ncbi:MAG TPA: D-alanine--D-alanine ligase family protein, partial [Solirubrobacteraceae bacterium]|nr:D-alanine--D-alanine ligase family protein [Solirubrobacteraceae bacterium]
MAVLAGGRSSEHDVSLASGASVREGLEQAGHEVVAVELRRDGSWRCAGEEVALRPGRGLLETDAAFPVLHGPFGEDGTVQGLLELLDVPYVGSGVLASALCMDKVLSKDLFAHAELPQVAYAAVSRAGWESDPEAVARAVAAMGPVVFVKPARLGSSVGIARVDDPGTLADALEGAFTHDPSVIVEAASAGIEVECSVLGPTHHAQASEPGEILLPGGWYDFEAKYTQGGMERVVPARVDAGVRDEVRRLAVEAFTRSGCAGLAR